MACYEGVRVFFSPPASSKNGQVSFVRELATPDLTFLEFSPSKCIFSLSGYWGSTFF